MPHQPIDSDPSNWHRYFATECNNRAWDLTIKPRTATEDREMLDSAHAAAWHWSLVGSELNDMRAKMLFAEVHSLLGYSESALSYADEMRRYFLNTVTADWEVAFTHSIYAHACFVAGEVELFRDAYRLAEQAISSIADKEDRDIVLKTFVQMPSP